MSKLLQDLETPQKQKVAFQSYLLEHGIEKLTLLVPLLECTTFEKRFGGLTKKRDIVNLVHDLGGKVKE